MSFKSFGASHTRRSFLKNSAVSLAALTYASHVDARQFQEHGGFLLHALNESHFFPLGVASGDATSDRAVLWTNYIGNKKLMLTIWQTREHEPVQHVLTIPAKPSSGGFVQIDVSGLKAGQTYQYGFVEIDTLGTPQSRSLIGHFRCAPDFNTAQTIKIGACCCTKNIYEPYILEHAGARRDLDAFFLLGDTSYNDGAYTLQEYRDKWATNLGKAGYLKLRSSTSVIAALDDHEVTDNFDPETMDQTQLFNAKSAFFENLPIRRSHQHPDRIWRQFRYGKTLEVFVLDCRTERLPSTRYTNQAQYISQEQMDWVKKGLLESDATFKVIINTVPISDFPMMPTADRWHAYPNQREEILSFTEEAPIENLLWVSGDFHFASYGLVASSGLGSKSKEVLVGPGAQISNPLAMGYHMSSRFEWASARNNYVTLTFRPDKLEVDMEYLGNNSDTQANYSARRVRSIHKKTLSLQG